MTKWFIFIVILIIGIYILGCEKKYMITNFENDKGIFQAVWLDNNKLVIAKLPNLGNKMEVGCDLFVKQVMSPSKEDFLYSEKNYNSLHLVGYITDEDSLIYSVRSVVDKSSLLNFYKINVLNKPANPTLLYTLSKVWDYAISNDGKKLAYIKYEKEGKSSLYLMDLTSQKEELVYTYGTRVTTLAFSPKGDILAVSDDNWAIDAARHSLGYIALNNKNAIEQLTEKERDAWIKEIVWSKDGNNIYFFEYIIPDVVPRNENPIKKTNICSINLNDRRKKIIYQSKGRDMCMGLDLSPDGQYLSFIQSNKLTLLNLMK